MYRKHGLHRHRDHQPIHGCIFLGRGLLSLPKRGPSPAHIWPRSSPDSAGFVDLPILEGGGGRLRDADLVPPVRRLSHPPRDRSHFIVRRLVDAVITSDLRALDEGAVRACGGKLVL